MGTFRFKLTILLCSLLLAVVASVAFPDTYTPDQVKALIEQRGIDWAANWIAGVYNAIPVVTMPALTAAVTNRDVGIGADGPIVVEIDGKLRYRLTVGPWTFKGVVPGPDFWLPLKAGGVGFLIGAGSTLILFLVLK